MWSLTVREVNAVAEAETQCMLRVSFMWPFPRSRTFSAVSRKELAICRMASVSTVTHPSGPRVPTVRCGDDSPHYRAGESPTAAIAG
jgi:hypothetical protein